MIRRPPRFPLFPYPTRFRPGLGVFLALPGFSQYIVAVPIPASWMTHPETAVRTRVYSIFGSPNIMGD